MKRIILILIVMSAITGCASYGKLERAAGEYSDMPEYFQEQQIPDLTGTETGIYFDGEQWFNRALELIEQAEDYILINSFLTTEHENTRIILDALKRRMDEGIRVYCIFDSSSYFRTYPNTTDPVRSAIPYVKKIGIPYTEYNPIRGRRVFSLLGLFDRDHRKYWVVDGKMIAAGGQNIDYDSIRFPEDSGCIDTMVEIESRELSSSLVSSFINSWNSYSINKLDVNDFPIRSADEGRKLWVFNQGHVANGEVTSMFDGFFAFAEKEIWMVQCYTFVTPALLDKVKFAVDRGVEVNFIISENQIAERFEKASLYSIKSLIEVGANVYLFDSPDKSLLHYKLIFADDEIASIGSANFNLRSQTFSRELSVVLEDPASIDKVRSNLNDLMVNCRIVSELEAESYRGSDYMLNFLLMQFWG